MSWVFLTDEHALKLKKPVRFPFLDFCTLAARAHFCAEEVQLNRRLAPGVYLGLRARGMAAPSRRSPPKPLPAYGDTVDWLVLMRRLPPQRMLDRLIAEGRVGAEIDALVAPARTLLRRPAPGSRPSSTSGRRQR